jgi:hypothetical protein
MPRLKPLSQLSPAHRRRRERGIARGLSPSQAGGHPKKGELSVSELKRKGYLPKSRKEEPARRAIRRMARGESMTRAARAEGIHPSTVKRYGMEHGLLEHVPHEEARRFAPSYRVSRVPRFRLIEAGGLPVGPVQVDARNASILGRYWNAVKKWRHDGDASALGEFRGVVVKDVHGKPYTLATNPQEIDLAFALMSPEESEGFEQNIYGPGGPLVGIF